MPRITQRRVFQARITLREIQDEWNRLVPLANERGITAAPWARIPQTRDRGLRRLNVLRRRLGIEIPDDQQTTQPVEVEQSIGATLSLRGIVAEYNRLVPVAAQQGITIQPWRGIPSTARRGMQRLHWLRTQIRGLNEAVSPLTITAVQEGFPFSGLTFGVEIECYTPSGLYGTDIAALVTRTGIDCRNEVYNHQRRTWWKVVTDGSLRNYQHGIELVSPILSGPEGFAQVRKVCEVLETSRCKINKSCGLHVHVGINEEIRTAQNAILLYDHFEDAIDSFMAPSRRKSASGFALPSKSYVRDVAGRTFNNMLDLIRAYGQHPEHGARTHFRYRKANLLSWLQHKTIEFRQHQGTIDADRTENWLKLCLRIVLAARQRNDNNYGERTLDNLLAVVGASDEAAFFHSRANYFAGADRRAAAYRLRREQASNPYRPFQVEA